MNGPGAFTEADLERADADAAFRLEERRVIALIAALAALAVPRRTRPLAGVLYGCALSRVHGAGRARLGREIGQTVGRLFSEKTSVGARVTAIEERLVVVESGRFVRADVGYVDPDNDSGAQG